MSQSNLESNISKQTGIDRSKNKPELKVKSFHFETRGKRVFMQSVYEDGTMSDPQPLDGFDSNFKNDDELTTVVERLTKDLKARGLWIGETTS